VITILSFHKCPAYAEINIVVQLALAYADANDDL
jgi:hypothetical protein